MSNTTGNTTTVANHDLCVLRVGEFYLYDRTPQEIEHHVKPLTTDRSKAVRLPRWQAFELAVHYAVACDCGNESCGYPVAMQVDIEPDRIH